MKRWLAVLLLMLGGLGAEAVRPGPCQLMANTWTHRLRGRGSDQERQRRGF